MESPFCKSFPADWSPALLAHDAAQLAAALAVAAPWLPPGRVLPIVSIPSAATWLAPELFLRLVALGQAGSGAACLPVLDCGAAAGHALAALRAGCPAVVLHPACPARRSVASVAAALGAALLPAPPPTLDLLGWRPDSPFGTARLRGWLTGDSAGTLG